MFSTGAIFRLVKVKTPEEAKRNGKELLKEKHKILAIAAHPDDLEYYIGGTLNKLSISGSEITAVIATKNGKNGDIRKEEQKKAGEILGYKEIIFLDFPDGSLSNHEDKLKEKLEEIITKKSPDVLFAFDIEKEGLFYHHKDHRVVGRTALELLKTHKEICPYFYHTRGPNTSVDISEVIERKIEAFNAHKSQQHGSFLSKILGDSQLKKYLGTNGKTTGTDYAEVYRKVGKPN